MENITTWAKFEMPTIYTLTTCIYSTYIVWDEFEIMNCNVMHPFFWNILAKRISHMFSLGFGARSWLSWQTLPVDRVQSFGSQYPFSSLFPLVPTWYIKLVPYSPTRNVERLPLPKIWEKILVRLWPRPSVLPENKTVTELSVRVHHSHLGNRFDLRKGLAMQHLELDEIAQALSSQACSLISRD